MLKIEKQKSKKKINCSFFFCNIDLFFIDTFYIIPKNIKINIKNNKIYLKGLIGQVNYNFSNNIIFFIKYNKLFFVIKEKKEKNKLIKLNKTLIKSSIKGILQGYKQNLIIKGLGFKITKKDNKLILKLGFSHNIIIIIPKKIKINIKNNKMKISSFDYIILTQFIYYLRSYKKKNYYKEKGILFENEKIFLKEGKKNKK